MPRYTVLSPVKHGRKRYEVGSRLELSTQEAQPLLALGDIEPAKAEKAPPPPAPPPPAAPTPPPAATGEQQGDGTANGSDGGTPPAGGETSSNQG